MSIEAPPAALPAPVESTYPVVVGANYILTSPSVIHCVRKYPVLGTRQETAIEDTQKQCLFIVYMYMMRRQYLHDAADQPVLCIEKEKVGWHAFKRRGRWKAYRGIDLAQNDALFTVKQVKSKVFYVFLPLNLSNETRPDFVIRGTGVKFTVFHNDHLLAETRTEGGERGSSRGWNVSTTAYPGADLAFVAAILLLMQKEFVDDASGGSAFGSNGGYGGGGGGYG